MKIRIRFKSSGKVVDGTADYAPVMQSKPKAVSEQKQKLTVKVRRYKSPPLPPYSESFNCPQCGTPFDPDMDHIVSCSRCHCPASTKCCVPAGDGGICNKCNAGQPVHYSAESCHQPSQVG
jgi:hypothetical protein